MSNLNLQDLSRSITELKEVIQEGRQQVEESKQQVTVAAASLTSNSGRIVVSVVTLAVIGLLIGILGIGATFHFGNKSDRKAKKQTAALKTAIKGTSTVIREQHIKTRKVLVDSSDTSSQKITDELKKGFGDLIREQKEMSYGIRSAKACLPENLQTKYLRKFSTKIRGQQRTVCRDRYLSCEKSVKNDKELRKIKNKKERTRKMNYKIFSECIALYAPRTCEFETKRGPRTMTFFDHCFTNEEDKVALIKRYDGRARTMAYKMGVPPSVFKNKCEQEFKKVKWKK